MSKTKKDETYPIRETTVSFYDSTKKSSERILEMAGIVSEGHTPLAEAEKGKTVIYIDTSGHVNNISVTDAKDLFKQTGAKGFSKGGDESYFKRSMAYPLDFMYVTKDDAGKLQTWSSMKQAKRGY